MTVNNRKFIGLPPSPPRGEDSSEFLAALRKQVIALQMETVRLTASTSTATGTGGSGAPVPGPPGPAGPPGTPYVPDLTPPPTPSGVVVSAGLDFIFITTDAPTFSQGNGYQRTIVYGTTYGGSGPLPTFSDAVRVHEFVGQVGSFAAEMGVQWHIWLKWLTKDNVESVSPSGGANGHQATTALLGNVHLGPLIVEAENLANGSVTGTKLADGAIGMTKFALGIRPPRVVGSLPISPFTGYAQGDTVVLTTDNKLYRFTGTDWTRAVDGTSDIVANSITAGSIAAGAIGATQIAANAITTDKLLVTGRGAALNADPTARDPSAWVNLGGTPATFVSGVLDFPAGGSTAIRAVSGATSRPFSSDLIPIDSAKNYRMEAWFYRSSLGSPTCICYFAIAWYDADGNYLPSNSAQPGGAGSPAGWSNGIYSYGGLVNATPPVGWNRYVFAFGQDETAKIPSNARFVRIGALLNHTANLLLTDVLLSGVRLMEKASADLIVDGAITANKIAANAIVAGTAVIQNGAIINAMIADATITNAKIVSLSATKITAGTIAVGEYIQSSDFVTGISGWRMGGNMAELGAAYIRGQLTASQINGNGLVIRDNSGNAILGVNNPIAASYIAALIGGGNLLQNSSFELDTNGDGVPDYWTGESYGSGITITRALIGLAGFYVDGAFSQRLSVTAISGASTSLHAVLQTTGASPRVVAGMPYSLSVLARTNTLAYECHLGIRWLDESDVQVGSTVFVDRAFTATSGFELMKLEAQIAPAGAVKARVQFGIRRPSAADTTTGSIWYDCIQLEQSEKATGYTTSHRDKTGLDNPITSSNIATYMAAAAIGSAYISDLSASKITAGNIQAGGYIRSTTYTPGSAGWTVNADGTAEFASTSIRGKLSASNLIGSQTTSGYSLEVLTVSGGQINAVTGPATPFEMTLETPNVGNTISGRGEFVGYLEFQTTAFGASTTYILSVGANLTLEFWNGSSWVDPVAGGSILDRMPVTAIQNLVYRVPLSMNVTESGINRTRTKMRIRLLIDAEFQNTSAVTQPIIDNASFSGTFTLQQLPN